MTVILDAIFLPKLTPQFGIKCNVRNLRLLLLCTIQYHMHTCLKLLSASSGFNHGDVLGHSVVNTLVHLASCGGARVVAQFHPQCFPWTTCKVIAHQSQEAA